MGLCIIETFLQFEDVALVVDVVHLVHSHPHDVSLEHRQLGRQVQASEARLHRKSNVKLFSENLISACLLRDRFC